MEKGQLPRKITSYEEERLMLARVLDQYQRSRSRNIPAATHFLTPQEQSLARELLCRLDGEGPLFFGGYEEAERCVALFLPEYLDAAQYAEEEEFPVCAVRCHFRAGEHPTHRDFLGSLMGLGIRREMTGDILVSEESCDLLLCREVLEFVLQHYSSAGRTRLQVESVALNHLHLPEQKRQELHDTVAALRLDSVAASAFRISRSRAAELIRAGKVEVNWRVCEKADHLCSEGDLLTARGFGKCRLAEVGGLSRKGRINIRLERYR